MPTIHVAVNVSSITLQTQIVSITLFKSIKAMRELKTRLEEVLANDNPES